ncbi:hypothetical protein [Haladaptatus cibarius]|uniref:hypothetical protein n=1 Tax=Haladaptatus cibarius TaxID=453847 RepID=UPI001185C7FF|nr:hypothetical protein [Haladaptatus cibarius]
MKRREVIFSTVSILSLGGCSSIGEEKSTKLSDISILNLDSSGHTLKLKIKSGEDIKYNKVMNLPKSSEIGTSENPAPVINEDWMNEPSTFTIKARVENNDWHELKLPTSNRPGSCYWVVIRIREDGSLEMPYDANASGCE